MGGDHFYGDEKVEPVFLLKLTERARSNSISVRFVRRRQTSKDRFGQFEKVRDQDERREKWRPVEIFANQ